MLPKYAAKRIRLKSTELQVMLHSALCHQQACTHDDHLAKLPQARAQMPGSCHFSGRKIIVLCQ